LSHLVTLVGPVLNRVRSGQRLPYWTPNRASVAGITVLRRSRGAGSTMPSGFFITSEPDRSMPVGVGHEVAATPWLDFVEVGVVGQAGTVARSALPRGVHRHPSRRRGICRTTDRRDVGHGGARRNRR